MTNPYQPDDTHPGTNEWATQQQQQYQQPYYQQPYQSQPPYQPQQKSNTGLVVALSVLGTLVLLALAGAVAFLVVRSDGTKDEQQDPVIVTEIETVAPEADNNGSNGSNGNQGNKPNVNRREPMGSSAGFSNATAETGNTSSEFAGNVLAVFNERAAATGEFPGSLSVYSPVTGQTYTMSCWPAGGGARCQGGNNASVYLY